MKYETLKVFDCQDMPDDVKKMLFEHGRDIGVGWHMDSYVPWGVANEFFDDENDPWAVRKKTIDAWLIANGARGPADEDDAGEDVLIHYWR